MFYTYIIKNLKGIIYKGSTDNPVKRLWQHNTDSGFPSYTAKRGPWKLIHLEVFKTRKEAEAREKYFKSGSGRRFLKQKLIDKD